MNILFAKIKKDIITKLVSFTKNKKSGLTWLQKRKLKYASETGIKKYSLDKYDIYFKSGNELIHGLQEIFDDEHYKFTADSANPYIIDCGSNIGLSVLYFKRLFPQARITAFEPDSENFKLLKENTQSLTDTKIFQKAVWNETKTLLFESSGTMSSSISIEKNKGMPVEAIRLKDLLIEKVDFLKIDIEGAEYAILIDCKDCLYFAENIFIEYHGSFNQVNELHEIFTILINNGFQFYIKEAANVYLTPFYRENNKPIFDIQLNIFCFKNK